MLAFSSKKSRRDISDEKILHNIFCKISKPSTRLCEQTYTVNAKFSTPYTFFSSFLPFRATSCGYFREWLYPLIKLPYI